MDKVSCRFHIRIASSYMRWDWLLLSWPFFVWASTSGTHNECTSLIQRTSKSWEEGSQESKCCPSISCTRSPGRRWGRRRHSRSQQLLPQTLDSENRAIDHAPATCLVFHADVLSTICEHVLHLVSVPLLGSLQQLAPACVRSDR